ncbi:conjugative transposon protein TraN [Flavobacterium johnsoniae]|uniref:Bacteroides conjugative transposon TraN-like protein n=1 Tax=Flavobacterium johnsoniae (strain ATCC 17061 / DSM 2064 / JCM 8514 / BCRC 14874 / CCUG 350202 / NBRC 14942 / NCIMB 11054 / UW101) TaxID=376686 RepID=A5FE19_FLAJ1|nr:conjugative transposon protein TraN [Flavobacterium johnsoniae]ABQ06552.1 Bacteroides conjugative transposon TraN-like protein [Flavobacterium johnsoniae UW101]OXE99789.1 conjugative transposon protein TraN [Flavobacterium johnsoniae UW101]WQG82304.1 conjugative transposon protein TraN [Flavobacterium johnsoniae UW101]SHK79228.1 Bacteroides conjugative transposon TraN protein [Flavobacterium johnsoniae]
MKKYNLIYFISFSFLAISSFAQLNNRKTNSNADNLVNLNIGYSKTTSLVFPYAIKSIDKGSPDIIMQKAKGVENILLLKANRQNFAQTNLTIITADSRLYVFVLNYNDDCPDLNVNADNLAVVNDDILFSKENENQKKIEQFAALALAKKKKITGIQRSKFDIKLSVSGIFIHEDVMYFRLVIDNNSKINYELDQLRFFIRDKKKAKRTASQEIEIIPLYDSNSRNVIAAKSEWTAVYAMPKVIIPEKKYLTIQLIEKNGERQLEVDINNNLTKKISAI